MRSRLSTLVRLPLYVALSAAGLYCGVASAATSGCPADDTGLSLPAGFCASIFADDIGHARHMAVSPEGVVYVNTWSGRYYANSPPPAGGFLVALQDTKGAGKADVIERFGETVASGGAGGTGIALYKGGLYVEINDKIVRYAMTRGSIVPKGKPTTIVSGLPLDGDHPMHPLAFGSDGLLYVDVATATNACQEKNRTAHSPGLEPCEELKTRGGIWRYDPRKPNQVFAPSQRYATGIRNGEGFGVDAAAHKIFVTQHGRDQLHANWPELYQQEQEATLPAEEIVLLKQGGDYGWPRCYYDPAQKKLMLAPEYGGDGKKVGLCADKLAPVAAYPPHWGPNGMAFYDKTSFPERYRKGLFIAFHGSWDRAPYNQQGYNVVFQRLSGSAASSTCEIFAEGFAGTVKSPGQAVHRPDGVTVAPDGALYISDDVKGRIYRIVYKGGASDAGAHGVACPDPAAPAGPISANIDKPPEGTDPDAGVALPVPAGSTAAAVAMGNQIYHGEVGGASCTGCHGADGAGTPLGPNLADKEWLWSDGSVQGIAATITAGVAQPKKYRAPMPAMGGAALSADQVTALSAYVWGLSHRPAK